MYCLEMVYALEARTTYKCELSHAQYYAKIPKQLKLPESCGSRNNLNQSSINAKEKLKEGHLPSESEEEPSLSPPPFFGTLQLVALGIAPATCTCFCVGGGVHSVLGVSKCLTVWRCNHWS